MSNQVFAAYFDELAEGEGFSTAGRTITESDLVSFSALTGDWHPQHADAEWAAAGPFGGRIAHGMLLLSYSLGLAPIDPERVVALRGLESVRFKRPVAIGETICVRGSVTGKRELDPSTGLVSLDWRILGGDGKTAVRAELQAIWKRLAEVAQAENGAVVDELSPIEDGRLLV